MPTLMQKIRLALRGWSRRREEANREFLQKSTWGGGAVTPGVSEAPVRTGGGKVDIEGLVVAHLDTSARTSYYLDTQSGDVIESNVPLDGARYKLVPAASPELDREVFLTTIETNARLASPESFREELAKDRKLERAWFNFRNDRAIAAIDRWLREHRLK
jgi:hypothetical protein